jgi:site-specific DNA-methyltransferase (adenine-specific)
MTAKEHLHLVEKVISPQKQFKNVINDISIPENAIKSYFLSDNAVIFNRDCLEILSRIPENTIDMIFADPPYMLSNNGFTCQNGRMVNVNKGKWDKSKGFEDDTQFHDIWIAACRRVLKPEGTI